MAMREAGKRRSKDKKKDLSAEGKDDAKEKTEKTETKETKGTKEKEEDYKDVFEELLKIVEKAGRDVVI